MFSSYSIVKLFQFHQIFYCARWKYMHPNILVHTGLSVPLSFKEDRVQILWYKKNFHIFLDKRKKKTINPPTLRREKSCNFVKKRKSLLKERKSHLAKHSSSRIQNCSSGGNCSSRRHHCRLDGSRCHILTTRNSGMGNHE